MRWVALAITAAVAGCGARVDEPGLDPDGVPAPQSPDAASARPDAASPAAPDNVCGVAETQGDVGDLAATGAVRGQGTSGLLVYSLGAPTPATAADARPDAIYVELWDDYGPFLGGAAHPGTFSIAGDDLSYDTCGVCVFTLADVDPATGATRFLFATGGTVTIEAVGAAQGSPFAVDVSAVAFQEIDGQTFEPLASDCPSPLAHAHLAGTVETVTN